MTRLSDDLAFVQAICAVVRDEGLMREPSFDRRECQLVERDLRLDLYNVWHATRQLTHSDSADTVERWIRPPHLGAACYFGRVDVVERHVEAGLPLNGEDYGGNPIAAALEAFVVTPLHVRCVARLFAGGARVTLDQFDAFVEVVGSEHDRAIIEMILEKARHSDDPQVRARARGG